MRRVAFSDAGHGMAWGALRGKGQMLVLAKRPGLRRSSVGSGEPCGLVNERWSMASSSRADVAFPPPLVFLFALPPPAAPCRRLSCASQAIRTVRSGSAKVSAPAHGTLEVENT
jgi:hypothetical protein